MDTSKIIELYKSNLTTLQIANVVGCSKKTVSRILKQNGIQIKRYTGSLLGDGGVYRHHKGINSCRYAETHSIDQIQYALWKYRSTRHCKLFDASWFGGKEYRSNFVSQKQINCSILLDHTLFLV